MILVALLFLTALFLSYINGANDNFKGVATLYGSGTLSYNKALVLATVATLLGSLAAIFVANGLVASFSGKGLVPDSVAGGTDFLIAVGLGAGLTVLLATRIGIPISTTHSLVGGLVGAGITAPGAVNYSALGSSFVLPLMASPFIAFSCSLVLYWLLTSLRKKLGISKESCVCIGKTREYVPMRIAQSGNHMESVAVERGKAAIMVSDPSSCIDAYTGNFLGFSLQRLLDRGHIISAAAVSFARGLNDTPKIAGLLIATEMLDIRISMAALALVMAFGGALHARRVAETMSKKISSIGHGQGLSANLVTSLLVIVASRYGVPVSTTHVSVGSIFGIGLVSQNRNPAMIRSIILSWVVTLPVAAILSGAAYLLIAG